MAQSMQSQFCIKNIQMDLQNIVFSQRKDTLKYCFYSSKQGENGVTYKYNNKN